MGQREIAAELGDGWVAVGQLLPNSQRAAVFIRRRRLAQPGQEMTEFVVGGRHVSAELGDGGVVVGQLLLDCDRLAIFGLCLRRLAGLAQEHADSGERLCQVAAGAARCPGGRGERLLVGPRRFVGRKGQVVLARGGEEPAQASRAGHRLARALGSDLSDWLQWYLSIASFNESPRMNRIAS